MNNEKEKEKVFLPQLLGLIALVVLVIIDRFIWDMPDYVFLPLACVSLISMATGVIINLKRK